MQDTEGEGGDEGEAKPGRDEPLGSPVLVGFDHPAGSKSGLSAVLASSAAAFNLIRWAGVAYLAYLGLRAFRAGRPEASPGVPGRPIPLARSARKGLIVGLGNPKMVIFYVAFFPQFIHPAQGSQAIQMLILGAVFWVIGTVWDLAFASASGLIGNWLRSRPRIRAAQPRVEGLAYLGLAVWTGSSS